MPGKPHPGKRKLPSLWNIIAAASIAAMLYLAGFSLADSPTEVDVGALKEGGEWFLGFGGVFWSLYIANKHRTDGDWD